MSTLYRNAAGKNGLHVTVRLLPSHVKYGAALKEEPGGAKQLN